jgi:RHS repeat-associated protein
MAFDMQVASLAGANVMSYASWFKSLTAVSKRNRAVIKRRQRPGRRRAVRLLWIETLEDRLMPAILNWVGGSGDWGDPTHWDAGHIPSTGDDARIQVAGVTVMHSTGTDTVNSLLASGGTLVLSGGTLNVTTTLQGTSNFQLSGSTLGKATVVAGTTLTATGSSTLDGVTLAGDLEINDFQTVTAVNGLTLSNGRVGLQSIFSGGSPAALRLSGTGPQTLAGTGQVVFAGGMFGSNNQLSAAGQPFILAAGITVTTSSGGGTVGDPGQPLTIQGTVSATSSGQGIAVTGTSVNNAGSLQVTGSSLDVNNLQSNSGGITASAGSTLTLHGTWQNTGTISATNATVNLASTFTLAQLGTFNRSGGTVNLTGTLNNTGTTLALNDTTGSWNLAGGTIRNGTVTTAGQAQLIATANPTLDGVTLAGDLEINDTQTVTAVNGLTLSNGRVGLQSNFSNSSPTALRLSGTGPQTLAGTGQVVFAGGAHGSNNQLSAVGQPFILAAGITVTTSSGGGTVGVPGQPLTIQGTVTATASGQGIAVTGTSISNQGTLSAIGGTLSIISDVHIDSSGILAGQAPGTITVAGNLLGTTSNGDLFAPLGTVLFNGQGTAAAPQLLEVRSNDQGSVSQGFARNFNYGTLALANNTYVKLTESSMSNRALYVNTLIVPAGCTLDLNGLHVYARAVQADGMILGGSVNEVPPGPLALGTPVPGLVTADSQVDDWTFFGRAGQSVTIIVHTGSLGNPPPLSPFLNFAQVQLRDSHGNVVAQNANTQSGADVSLLGVNLPADDTYHIQVRPGQAGSRGHYLLTAWDATPHTTPLTVNQVVTGQIDTPFRADRWTFAAAAGDPVRFDLLNGSSPGLRFDLTGPNGYVGFQGLAGSSDLLTLPTAGTYVLRAYVTGTQTGAYTVRIRQTAVIPLQLGTPYHGQLEGSAEALLFQVNVPASRALQVDLSDNTAADHNEVYVKLGAPPTRADYQFRSGNDASANQQVLVPSAAPTTWYILVYDAFVAQPSNFALSAIGAGVVVSGVTPDHAGNAAAAVLTVTGAGFDATSMVSLVAGNGTTYRASTVQLDLPTQLTATFLAGVVPAGVYTVSVTRGDGARGSLANAFTMKQGGRAQFNVNLVTPSLLGYHIPSTLYLQYSNTGDLAMPAPVIDVTITQTHANGTTDAKALLTLDGSIVTQGFWTSALPDGFSNTVDVLASGATPGVLEPGEAVQVPIYYAGWQQPWDLRYPLFHFDVGVQQTTDPTPVDWPSLQANFRPPDISPAAWNALFPNLQAQLGNTLGAFVQRLDDDAQYLGHLGEQVNDINALWYFEVQQANGFNPLQALSSQEDVEVPTPGPALTVQRAFFNSIDGRYQTGPFGRGWQWIDGWQSSLTVASDGTVTVPNPDGSPRRFQPDSRVPGAYFAEMGDHGTLTAIPGSGFNLTEADGMMTHFDNDGKIGFVQDPNGNRVTAGYTNGMLTNLTASAGQSLAFTYNSAGLISAITDSTQRTTVYTYDSTNQFLMSVTDFAGRVTRYTYDVHGTPLTANALLSVENPDGTTDHFTYDAQGRLATTYTDVPMGSPMGQLTYTYGPAGDVAVTDADQGTSRYSYDQRGLAVKFQDALGNTTHLVYDGNFNLVQVIDAVGQVTIRSYDNKGNVISRTDPDGATVTFSYSGLLNKLTSYTDPNGNTTSYNYDNKGNLLSVTYPNNSLEQFSYDPMGNLTETINRRGQAIRYTYNSAGLVTRKDFADGTHQDFTYDLHANITTATDADGTTTFQYDPVTADLIQVTYPGGRFLKFRYDGAGNRIQSVDQDGFTVNYQYEVGMLAGLTDGNGRPIVTYTYDAAGRLIRKDLGNGTYTTYAYDLAGNILHLVNHAPDGSVNSQFDYTYDTLGRPMSMTTEEGQWTYQYDPDGQLTHAVFTSNNPDVVPNQDLQYTYDLAGNRTQTVINGVTTQYVTNSLNEYTRVGSTNFTYDADGNLISETDGSGTTTYTYDEENQLTKVMSATETSSYRYDSLGNLEAITRNGQTTQFLVDTADMGNIVGEYDGAGNLVAHYTFGLGLTSRVAPDGQTYYDFDALGSTAGLSGSTGRYMNHYAYDPFGASLLSNETTANPFRYVGERGVMEIGTGLKFMRARDYMTNLGRFISEDPLGLQGGDTNLQRYGFNNPITNSDSTGLGDDLDKIFDELKKCLERQLQLTLCLSDPDSSPSGGEFAELTLKCHFLEQQFAFAGADPAKIKKLKDDLKKLFDDEKKVKKGKCGGNGGPGTGGGVMGQGCAQNGMCGGGGTPPAAGMDPNAKVGPAGFGPQGFVAPGTVLPYRIDFENDPTATVPAQRVVVTDQLNANLDWNTFQLVDVGFGDQYIAIPPGSQHFQTTVPMTYNGETFQVEIELGLDPATGLITAVFQSIDPATSLPPDILTGFLPPEDGTGRGMGYFRYTILAKPGLPTGTQIRNIALVTFDTNAAIATNQVDDNDPSKGTDPTKETLITIDAVPPTSRVSPLPADSPPTFLVTWAGADDAGGSGLAFFDVYVSDDGGPFTLWLAQTTRTQAAFTGMIGHTYGFYSVATDNAGNREATPTMAQATTVVSLAATPTHIQIVPAGNAFTAGTPFTITVRILDAGGNVVPGYTGTVHFGSSDPQAALPPDYAFTVDDAGVHTFTVTLFTAGPQTLIAGDALNNISGQAAVVNEFATPTANSGPSGITYGPDGNVWFVEANTGKIGRIAPDGTITEFALPSPGSRPLGITTGPDGNLWFTEFNANRIGMITPDGSTILEFILPTPNSGPEGIVAGPDGNLWFTEYNASQIGMISPDGSTIMEFPLPTPNSGPMGITVGPDGNLWFTEFLADQIGMISPDGSILNEYALPTPNSGPMGIAVGSDGYVWFTEFNANQVGSISPDGSTVVEWPIPTVDSGPQGITSGPGGNLWFTEFNANQVGQISPAAGTVAQYNEIPVSASGLGLSGIVTGADGNLWFSESQAGAIGELIPVVVVTAAPADHFVILAPASVAPGMAFDMTVLAVDPYGNIDTHYQGTIHFTSTDPDPGVVLPADYTFQPGDAGAVTFTAGVTLMTAGDQTITVTDGDTGLLTGSTTVNVTAGPASSSGKHGRSGRQTSSAVELPLWALVPRRPELPAFAGIPNRAPQADEARPLVGFEAGGYRVAAGSSNDASPAIPLPASIAAVADEVWLDVFQGLWSSFEAVLETRREGGDRV